VDASQPQPLEVDLAHRTEGGRLIAEPPRARSHIDALVLVGAQAVYLRSEGRTAGYQAHTTDAEVMLDPAKLGPIPPLGLAMETAASCSPPNRAAGTPPGRLLEHRHDLAHHAPRPAR